MNEAVTISRDDAAALLGYLDDAAAGLDEYGAPDEAFDELDALKRRLHLAIFGVEMPPKPEPAPLDPKTAERFRAFARAMLPYANRSTPFLSMIGKAQPPTGETIHWGVSEKD